MKIKFTILLIVICFINSNSFSQRSFRLKKLEFQKCEEEIFILPPKSNLKFKSIKKEGKKNKDIVLKDRFKYHQIKFIVKEHTSNKYFESINQLKRFNYKRSSSSLNKASKSKVTPFTINYSSFDSLLAIEFNYEEILKSNRLDKAFQNISHQLLMELVKLEIENDWPFSLSQSIVEETFNAIPLPEKSTLDRYICTIDESESYLLLNPHFIISVDTVQKESIGTQNWKYNYLGSNFFEFLRDEKGSFIQIPFYKFQVGGNIPDGDIPQGIKLPKNIYVGGSSGDIQFSKTIFNLPFIFIHQWSFKPNNSFIKINSPCQNQNDNKIACNCHFKHVSQDNMQKVFNEAEIEKLDPNSIDSYSSFGTRNLIKPFFRVILNKNLAFLPLNLNKEQLKVKFALPNKICLKRAYKTSMRRIKSDFNHKILPNDKISYKL